MLYIYNIIFMKLLLFKFKNDVIEISWGYLMIERVNNWILFCI